MYRVLESYITPNRYSRPQVKLKEVRALVIHYVANQNSTALNNRDYFESLKNQTNKVGNVYASAHEIIDLDGDVILCIPKDELAYHAGSKTYTNESVAKFGTSPNYYTYGIECTHVNSKGEMTKETVEALVERCVDLCIEFGLNPLTDIWLHKEVVGWKNCHLWFCSNPHEWLAFKNRIVDKIDILLKEGEEKVEKWKIDALKELSNDKLLEYDKWIDKLDEQAPVWLVTTLMNNLNKKLKEKK